MADSRYLPAETIKCLAVVFCAFNSAPAEEARLMPDPDPGKRARLLASRNRWT
jgi:hypothetical protein